MLDDRFALPPFVAHLFQVPELAITAFNMIVGSCLGAVCERLLEVHQELLHVGFAEDFQPLGQLSSTLPASEKVPSIGLTAQATWSSFWIACGPTHVADETGRRLGLVSF